MQDISRDDFSMLNAVDTDFNSTDKDMCLTLINKSTSPLSPITIGLSEESNNDNTEVSSIVPIKVEDINTIEFHSNSASWQIYQFHDLSDQRSFLDSGDSIDRNGTKLLLQGSDDPLISHGANCVLSNDDEHPADFAMSLVAQPNNHFQNQREESNLANQRKTSLRPVKSGCSNLTKQQLIVKANLMSARNQQHQSSPNLIKPQQNVASTASTPHQKNQRTQKTKTKERTAVKLRFHHQALPPEYLSHYEEKQKMYDTHQSNLTCKTFNHRTTPKIANSARNASQSRNSHENVRSWLQKIAEIQRTAIASKEGVLSRTIKPIEKHHCSPSTDETQNTSNRLSTDANNNDKAQKKFQSHSAVYDGKFLASINKSPNSKQLHYSDLPFMGEIILDNCKPRRGRKPKKADICHLIYKNYGSIPPKKTKPETRSNISSILDITSQGSQHEPCEQPLNLCLRDQFNDSYSISSGDDLSDTISSCPTPVSTSLDYACDAMLARNLKKSLRSINEQNEVETDLNTTNHSLSAGSEEKATPPITICYKKLLDSGRHKTIKKDNQLGLQIPIQNGFFLSQQGEKCSSFPIDSNADNGEGLAKTSTIQSENSVAGGISVHLNQQIIAPQKRKRSAIFIPPMNVENTKNPATEVSICKFKFTGGSKPTLKEKKMISVDAGGNYRYFSGTGDKASRGYEYFPRETLQHTAGLLPGVNCTGQKFYINIPPASHGLNNDLLNSTESTVSLALHSIRPVNDNTESVASKPTPTHFEANNNSNKSLYGAT